MNVRPGSPNYTRARETLSHNFVLNSNAEAGSGDITVSGPINVCVQSGLPLESNSAFAVTFGAGVTSAHYAAFAVERLPYYLRNQALQLQFDCYNSGAAGVYSVELHDNNNTVTPALTAISSGYVNHKTVFGSTASSSDYQIRFKSNAPGTLIINQLYVGRLVEGFSGSVSVSNTGTVNNTTNNYYSVSGDVSFAQLEALSGLLVLSGQILRASDNLLNTAINTLSGALIQSGQILRASDNLLNTAVSTLSGAVIVSGQTVLDRLFLSGQILQNATPASITLTNYSGDIYTPRHVTVSGQLTAPSLTLSGNVLTAQSGILYVNGQAISGSVFTAAISDWTPYNLTIHAVTTNPTKATSPAVDLALFRRVGDSMQIAYTYRQTASTGAANGDGTYIFRLPPGYAIDTTKLSVSNSVDYTLGVCGNGSAYNGTHCFTYVRAWDSSGLIQLVDYAGAGSFEPITHNRIALGSAADVRYSFIAQVPIVNWSSNVVVTDSRTEYVYNSNTTSSNDTSSFATGEAGGLVPNTSTDVTKRVETSREYKHIRLEVSDRGGSWQPVADSRYAIMRRGDTSTGMTGIGLKKYSSTQWDVQFNSYCLQNVNTTSEDSFATEYTNGTKWRLVASDNPLYVQTPALEALTITWEAASGGGNGDTTASSWRNYDTDATSTMTLNNPAGYTWCTIAGGNFTLTAGTYLCKSDVSMYDTDCARARIYNVTDSSVAIQGVNGYSNTSDEVSISLPVEGVITNSSTKSYRLEYYVNAGNTSRLGANLSTGENEVYARITLLKLR